MVQIYIFFVLVYLTLLWYYYFFWNKSEYKNQSQYGFLAVHLGLFLSDASWILRFFLKKYLGLYGEYCIYRELEKLPWPKRIFTNLYVPQGKTVTDTEVDLILIHESGIYVIESKDYRGWIFGNASDSQWTQSFSKWRKFHFYNPLRQNYSHIKSLEVILEQYSRSIQGMVVFSDRSELKKVFSPHEIVIHTRDIRKYISLNDILSMEEMENIANILHPYASPTNDQEKIHTEEIIQLQKGF